MDKLSKNTIVGSIVFVVALIVLLIGISFVPSPFAIPFCVIGTFGLIVGFVSLVCCLIDWCDKKE